MIHAARKAGTFLGEAFMYRLHPQTAKLVELVRSGAIGDVRMIRSSFGFAMPGFMPEHRLYANDLAGGGILDVGGYPVSMARLIAGAAVGQALCRAGQRGGRGASRPVGRRRMGFGAAAFSRRHRRRSLLQHLARPGQCAAHPRHQGPHRGQGFLVRRRQGRRHRQDQHHPSGRQRDDRGQGGSAGSIPSRPMRQAKRSLPASRNSPGRAWVGPTASAISACSTNGVRAVGLEYGIEKAASTRQHDLGPAAASRAARRSPSAAFPGLDAEGVGRGARLRGFPRPSRRARSCSTHFSRPAAICSTPASSMAPAAPKRCSANGW